MYTLISINSNRFYSNWSKKNYKIFDENIMKELQSNIEKNKMNNDFADGHMKMMTYNFFECLALHE